MAEVPIFKLITCDPKLFIHLVVIINPSTVRIPIQVVIWAIWATISIIQSRTILPCPFILVACRGLNGGQDYDGSSNGDGKGAEFHLRSRVGKMFYSWHKMVNSLCAHNWWLEALYNWGFNCEKKPLRMREVVMLVIWFESALKHPSDNLFSFLVFARSSTAVRTLLAMK